MIFVLIALLGLCAPAISGQTFDRQVLASSPVLPPDSVGIVHAGIRHWMSQQSGAVPPEYLPPVREDLYRVIQSVIWHTTESLGTTELRGSDNAATLFDLATYLGVYGAGLVARDLAESDDLELASPLLPTSPMRMQYSRPLFELAWDGGWAVSFPYYFMVWGADVAPADAGGTGFVAISTLHGRHTVAPRTSQATILMVTTRETGTEEFSVEWRRNLGIPDEAMCEADDWPIVATHRACHENLEGVMVEAGILTSAWGSVLLVYSGLGGTFEANRPHFHAFLESFHWR